jgi:lipopolysaccharide export system permease protein
MRYLGWEFLIKFLLFLFILLSVVFVFELIELVKRASGQNIGLNVIISLSLYKLPEVGQQILPFVVLFATIACLYSLSQRQELQILRASGLSVWQFLMPMIIAVFLIGLIFLNIFHPLTAAALARYDNLENLYFNNGKSEITIIDEGLWLRQEDETGNFIMQADTVNADNWTFESVTVYFFDDDNHHTQRLTADKLLLENNSWLFQNVYIQKPDATVKILPELRLKTNLTKDSIAESFSDPRTISFWRLPGFINALEKTGLDTTQMKIYYQTLLSQPLFLISMVLMAAATSLRTSRFTSLLPLVTIGIGFGFLTFFMTGFLRALGAGQEIPIELAVWTPSIIIILCASAFLISMEDG